MTRRRKIVLGVMGLAPVLLLASTFCSSPLPMPKPFAGPLPSASPPPTMALFKLPTGVTHRSAGFAYRGGSFRDKRDFAMTAALVRHPKGDLMIDTGFGRHIGEHFKLMPAFFRATTSYEAHGTAFDQLGAAGYDPKSLRAIVLTHAHWDHVSGLPEFPDTPVWVTPEERRFIESGGFVTAVARSCTAAKYEEIRFEGPPYLGFPASRDVYGDGSIVMVPAPGHTPGSLIVFVTIPGDRRYAFVGDLVWQREGILEREERPWLQRSLADEDPPTLRESLLRMNAIARAFPAFTIVPAHDARAYEGLIHLR